MSVIIVNRNGRDLLLNCLASLVGKAEREWHEVIVVDNGSSDGTLEAVRTEFPQVRTVEARENLGFAAANNLGAAEASGGLLLFLNNDTVVQPGALGRLSSAFEADPQVGIAAPSLVGPDGRDQGTMNLLMTPATVLVPGARRRAQKELARVVARSGELAGRAYFCGAAVMVRRSAFESVGGFDPSFFFYCEDPDFCKRLADNGWEMAFVPDATIIHIGSASSKRIRVAADIERHRGRCRYMRKHYGFVAATAAGLVFFLTAMGQAALNAVGLLLTLGLGRSFRRRALLSGSACLWFLCGMPGRGRWVYRRLFGDWQKV